MIVNQFSYRSDPYLMRVMRSEKITHLVNKK